jgi:uncharacterized membrane protein
MQPKDKRMGTGRLEAFSDGVLAIIITIMVLELKVPHDPSLGALSELAPVFVSYVLSFIYVGIYWNNHHHMLQVAESVTGVVLWANLHLLFWLSLLPFSTGWMGENDFAALPTFVYGLNLLLCAAAYSILELVIVRSEGDGSRLARALRHDRKGHLSLLLYAMGLAVAWFWVAWVGLVFFAAVALMWLVPDPRIERAAETDL